jgi:hypothetical protein
LELKVDPEYEALLPKLAEAANPRKEPPKSSGGAEEG